MGREADKLLLSLSETVASRIQADDALAEAMFARIKYNDLFWLFQMKDNNYSHKKS